MPVSFSKYTLVMLFAFSLVGIAAAGIIFVDYYLMHLGTLPLCSVTSVGAADAAVQVNCIAVISSKFGEVLGIPFDFLALAWFTINLFFILILIKSKGDNRRIQQFMLAWAIIGIAVVPYLVYVEIDVLKSLCLYCTTMHIAIILDFLFVIFAFLKSKG